MPRAAQDASKSPNEAIVLGFIGVGGMGSGLLNIFKEFPDVRVAAVCDVYEPHALRAKQAAGGSPEVYKDFREVLDRKDIDAVVVATPDHWHAIPSIMACQAGKDVYCEKPLAYTIGEGRRVADAAKKYNRVTQMGNLIHATENYHRMAEIVQSGVLGKITKVRIWMSPRVSDLGNPPDGEPPAGCDYDIWLGPAPLRAFNPNRFTFNWRYYWDYGGGWLADFVCHLLDPVHWAMKVTAPETIAAVGSRYRADRQLRDARHLRSDLRLPASRLSARVEPPVGQPARLRGPRRRRRCSWAAEPRMHGHYNDFKIIPEGNEEITLPEPSLASLARPPPRVARRHQDPRRVLVQLRVRPPAQRGRAPGQYRDANRPDAEVGRGGRAHHEP